MSYWVVTTYGPKGVAGYLAEADNRETAMAIVNDHLPPGWSAEGASPLSPDEAFDDLRNSPMVLRATRH